MSCTEKSRRWPDSLASVVPDELDEFLEHTEVCPYHAALLHAEEEGLREVFRQARGFDSHGRILQGDMFQAAVAEHQQRWKRWNDAASRRELPFSHISLYNHGEKIASCGKFLDFRRHDSVHELEPHAGIQIRGAISGDASEEVLLGFYPLVGVRHADKEYQLPLENGYTVGLRVHETDKTTFRVEFRCVEHEVIEREQAEALAKAAESTKERAKATGAGGSIFSRVSSWKQTLAGRILSASGGMRSYLTLSPAAMRSVSVLLVGALAIPVLALVRAWSPLKEEAIQGPNDLYASSAVSASWEEDGSVKGAPSAPAPVKESQPEVPPIGARRGAEGLSGYRPSQPTIVQTTRLLIGGRRQQSPATAGYGRTAAATNSAAARGDAAATVTENSVSWRLLVSMGEDEATERRLYVLHVGTDEKLVEQLTDAIRASNNSVTRLNGSLPEHAPETDVKVDWNLQQWANGIEMQTVVYVGGQQATVSFSGKGDSPEHASKDALGQAVPGVNGLIEGLLKRQGISVRLDADEAQGATAMVNTHANGEELGDLADENEGGSRDGTGPVAGGALPEGREVTESVAEKEDE